MSARAAPPGPRQERRSSRLDSRWRQVLEAAHDPYLAVDRAGMLVEVNARAQELFGPPATVGCDVRQLVVPGLRDRAQDRLERLVSAAALEHDMVFATELLGSAGPFPAECTVWGRDRRGETVLHVFVRDTSERRRAQVADARLAAVVDGASEAVFTCDISGTLVTWNPAAEQIFGWRAAEVLGRPCLEVLPSQGRCHPAEPDDRWVETELPTRSGVLVPVSLRRSAVRGPDGDVVAVSTLVQDVTERRFLARTLDEALVALQRALEEARVAEEATRRFLTDAAHQLRTPVTGIRACAEALLRGVPPEDSERLLTVMVRETSRAGRLVTALLTMAQLDQGVPLSTAPVDVIDACRHEVERLALLAPQLDVRLDAPPDGHPPLTCDGARLAEVLSNLGDNARRHARRAVWLRIEPGTEHVRLLVLDDGPGLPVELRERVFERFVSLDGAGGSGLGLAVARGLVEAGGGTLAYEVGPESGGGGFAVTLPLSTSASSTSRSPARSSSSTSA